MSAMSFVNRHKASLASGGALLIASSLLVAYAVNADGYRKHDTDLNDGGVWVVNAELGMHGRINKPVEALDGTLLEDDAGLDLDVVQEGARVVTINRNTNTMRLIEPRLLFGRNTELGSECVVRLLVRVVLPVTEMSQ